MKGSVAGHTLVKRALRRMYRLQSNSVSLGKRPSSLTPFFLSLPNIHLVNASVRRSASMPVQNMRHTLRASHCKRLKTSISTSLGRSNNSMSIYLCLSHTQNYRVYERRMLDITVVISKVGTSLNCMSHLCLPGPISIDCGSLFSCRSPCSARSTVQA